MTKNKIFSGVSPKIKTRPLSNWNHESERILYFDRGTVSQPTVHLTLFFEESRINPRRDWLAPLEQRCFENQNAYIVPEEICKRKKGRIHDAKHK